MIALAYEAVMNPSLWPAALRGFAECAGAIDASAVCYDAATGVVQFGIGGQRVISPEAAADYERHYGKIDPLRADFERAPDGGCVSLCPARSFCSVGARSRVLRMRSGSLSRWDVAPPKRKWLS